VVVIIKLYVPGDGGFFIEQKYEKDILKFPPAVMLIGEYNKIDLDER